MSVRAARPVHGPALVLAVLAATLLAAPAAVAASAGSSVDDAAAPRWHDTADGFAGLAGEGVPGTTGGRGGPVVTVTTQADLDRYATAAEPYVIRVAGAVRIEPRGIEIRVASNKTIIGVGTRGHIVGGGFFLGPGVHNVIIRNLTIRDSAVPGDPDGKCCDADGIQMDTAHHVWIDHNHLTNLNDGLIDMRMDTTDVTVSWNVLSDHNKAFGIGWTSNVTARLTMHHNWLRDIYQRGPSADNLAAAHLYNNYLQRVGVTLPAGATPPPDYVVHGNWARGQTRMILENSYFDTVVDPYWADETGALEERGSIVRNSTGHRVERGTAFDPRAHYAYRLDPAAAVPGLLRRFAGPQASLGGPPCGGRDGSAA